MRLRRRASQARPDQGNQDHQKREHCMTPQDQITKMTAAIRQAIKVMGDRFGSTEQDVARAIHELKVSMQKETASVTTLEDSTATKQPAIAG
jgi:ribosomal protein L9